MLHNSWLQHPAWSLQELEGTKVVKRSEYGPILAGLIEAAQFLHGQDCLASYDGNLSYRFPNGVVAITPTGVAKSRLRADDFAFLDMDGKVLAGQPSSESLLHLTVYRNCSKARAVIHSHPPCAVGWSLAHPQADALPVDALAEVILACGGVPQAPFAIPGSEALAASIEPFLPLHRIIILARHGAVTWGEDIDEALRATERLEHTAKILRNAASFGPIQSLDSSEVNQLLALRETLGERVL